MPGSPGDTSLGGTKRDFPSTCWFRFLKSRDPGAVPDDQSIETLAAAYWKPIYVYCRRKWSRSNEEAKDLTQAFFVWMIESGFVGKADPQRGRFRAFLKVALDRFMMNERRDAHARKRGGDRRIVMLGSFPDEAGAPEIEDPAARTPEEALDESWRNEILMRAREILETTFAAEGKETYFKVFRAYYLSETGEVDHKQLAGEFGIPLTDVGNYLRKAKLRFRAILTDLVAETVSGPDELRDELRFLFGEGAP